MESVERIHQLELELQRGRSEAVERREKMEKMANLMLHMEAELAKVSSGAASSSLHQEIAELRVALTESERLRMEASRRADSLESEVSSLRQTVNDMEMQLNDAHIVIDKFGHQVGTAEENEVLNLELERIRDELETTKRAFREQDSVLARAEEETLALVQTSRLKEQKMREERVVLENRVVTLEAEIGRFEADMKGAVGLWKARAEEFKAELLRVQSKVATMAIELEAAKARADACGAELERAMLDASTKEAKLDKMRQLMQRMENEVQTLQLRHRRDLDERDAEVDAARAEAAAIRSRMEALELDLQIERENVGQLSASSHGEKSRLASKEEAILKLEQEVLKSVEEASETVAKLNAEVEAAKREASGLRPFKAEAETLRADLARGKDEIARQNAEIVHLKEMHASTEKELDDTRQKLVVKSQLLSSALDEGEEAHEGLRRMKETTRQLREERQKSADLERAMATLKGELMQEKQFVAQMQGEIDALRARADNARQELDRELTSPHKDSAVTARLRSQVASLEAEIDELRQRGERQKQEFQLELSAARASTSRDDSARQEVVSLRAENAALKEQIAKGGGEGEVKSAAEQNKALEERCAALVRRAVLSEGEARRAEVRAVGAEEELSGLRHEYDETRAALNTRIEKLVKRVVQLEGDLQAAQVRANRSTLRSLDKSTDSEINLRTPTRAVTSTTTAMTSATTPQEVLEWLRTARSNRTKTVSSLLSHLASSSNKGENTDGALFDIADEDSVSVGIASRHALRMFIAALNQVGRAKLQMSESRSHFTASLDALNMLLLMSPTTQPLVMAHAGLCFDVAESVDDWKEQAKSLGESVGKIVLDAIDEAQDILYGRGEHVEYADPNVVQNVCDMMQQRERFHAATSAVKNWHAQVQQCFNTLVSTLHGADERKQLKIAELEAQLHEVHSAVESFSSLQTLSTKDSSAEAIRLRISQKALLQRCSDLASTNGTLDAQLTQVTEQVTRTTTRMEGQHRESVRRLAQAETDLVTAQAMLVASDAAPLPMPWPTLEETLSNLLQTKSNETILEPTQPTIVVESVVVGANDSSNSWSNLLQSLQSLEADLSKLQRLSNETLQLESDENLSSLAQKIIEQAASMKNGSSLDPSSLSNFVVAVQNSIQKSLTERWQLVSSLENSMQQVTTTVPSLVSHLTDSELTLQQYSKKIALLQEQNESLGRQLESSQFRAQKLEDECRVFQLRNQLEGEMTSASKANVNRATVPLDELRRALVASHAREVDLAHRNAELWNNLKAQIQQTEQTMSELNEERERRKLTEAECEGLKAHLSLVQSQKDTGFRPSSPLISDDAPNGGTLEFLQTELKEELHSFVKLMEVLNAADSASSDERQILAMRCSSITETVDKLRQSCSCSCSESLRSLQQLVGESSEENQSEIDRLRTARQSLCDKTASLLDGLAKSFIIRNGAIRMLLRSDSTSSTSIPLSEKELAQINSFWPEERSLRDKAMNEIAQLYGYRAYRSAFDENRRIATELENVSLKQQVRQYLDQAQQFQASSTSREEQIALLREQLRSAEVVIAESIATRQSQSDEISAWIEGMEEAEKSLATVIQGLKEENSALKDTLAKSSTRLVESESATREAERLATLLRTQLEAAAKLVSTNSDALCKCRAQIRELETVSVIKQSTLAAVLALLPAATVISNEESAEKKDTPSTTAAASAAAAISPQKQIIAVPEFTYEEVEFMEEEELKLERDEVAVLVTRLISVLNHELDLQTPAIRSWLSQHSPELSAAVNSDIIGAQILLCINNSEDSAEQELEQVEKLQMEKLLRETKSILSPDPAILLLCRQVSSLNSIRRSLIKSFEERIATAFGAESGVAGDVLIAFALSELQKEGNSDKKDNNNDDALLKESIKLQNIVQSLRSELSSSLSESDTLRNAVERANSEVERIRKEVENSQLHVEKVESEMVATRKRLNELEEQLAASQVDSVATSVANAAMFEALKQVHTEEMQAERARVEKSQQQRNSADIERLERTVKELREQLLSERGFTLQLTSAHEEAQETLESQRRQIANLQSNLASAARTFALHEKDHDALQTMYDSTQAQLTDALALLATFTTAEATNTTDEVDAAVSAAQEQYKQELESAKLTWESSLSRLQTQVDALTKQNQQLEESLAIREQELQTSSTANTASVAALTSALHARPSSSAYARDASVEKTKKEVSSAPSSSSKKEERLLDENDQLKFELMEAKSKVTQLHSELAVARGELVHKRMAAQRSAMMMAMEQEKSASFVDVVVTPAPAATTATTSEILSPPISSPETVLSPESEQRQLRSILQTSSSIRRPQE